MLFMLLLGLCPGSELGEVDLLVFVYMELLGQVISMYTFQLCTVYEYLRYVNQLFYWIFYYRWVPRYAVPLWLPTL